MNSLNSQIMTPVTAMALSSGQCPWHQRAISFKLIFIFNSLALHKNNLSSLPASFNLLRRLRYLNLRSNAFSYFPDVVSKPSIYSPMSSWGVGLPWVGALDEPGSGTRILMDILSFRKWSPSIFSTLVVTRSNHFQMRLDVYFSSKFCI